jgi:hypothetical protein
MRYVALDIRSQRIALCRRQHELEDANEADGLRRNNWKFPAYHRHGLLLVPAGATVEQGGITRR